MKWGQVLEKFTSTGSNYVYIAGVWRFFWYQPHTGANIRISSTQQNQKETMEREEVKYDQCATCLPLRESHIVSNILSESLSLNCSNRNTPCAPKNPKGHIDVVMIIHLRYQSMIPWIGLVHMTAHSKLALKTVVKT
jgi:hypothetical protein